MHRRSLIITAAAALAAARAFGQSEEPRPGEEPRDEPREAPRGDPYDERPPREGGYESGTGPGSRPAEPYSRGEMVDRVSDFLGVTAESAGAAIEKMFADNGRPTGYIAGEEGSGAVIVGLRYGRGLLYMKNRPTVEVFWQGPSVGLDVGGNASRVFTLCYNLQYPDAIFRRFPGVEGSAYLVGGLGVNYQRAEDITLAPTRAGVGLRLGANVGYLAYSRKRNILPF
ncbi:MAG TPA: DUF1134 domain-containing protein [Caulobacteraceae bacterium]|nr:DUF1134 domain-containing protein [Caulobacteraceae bacterium]